MFTFIFVPSLTDKHTPHRGDTDADVQFSVKQCTTLLSSSPVCELANRTLAQREEADCTVYESMQDQDLCD